MEDKEQKKNADKVFEKNEKEKTEEKEKPITRLAERKGQRPAFPFNRKKL